MNVHLIRDIEKLKSKLLLFAFMVEEALRNSVLAVENYDESLAKKTMDAAKAMRETRIDIEEECLKMLALHQVVAKDLRFIITVLKININLENLVSVSKNISKKVSVIAERKDVLPPFDFDHMSKETIAMLRNAIDSFINSDLALAKNVCKSDDLVDMKNKQMYPQVEKKIMEFPEDTRLYIEYLTISKQIEKAADYCVLISKDIIYFN